MESCPSSSATVQLLESALNGIPPEDLFRALIQNNQAVLTELESRIVQAREGIRVLLHTVQVIANGECPCVPGNVELEVFKELGFEEPPQEENRNDAVWVERMYEECGDDHRELLESWRQFRRDIRSVIYHFTQSPALRSHLFREIQIDY